MKHDKIAEFASLMAAIFLLVASCASTPEKDHEKPAVRLFIRLPVFCNTPDGTTMDAEFNVILSIPNFNNDALLEHGLIEALKKTGNIC